MQDQPPEAFRAEPAAPPPADKPFLTPVHYPSDLTTSVPARAGKPPGRGHLFTHVILPLALFLAVVVGVAWITQYLPSWRTRPQPGVTPGIAVVKFDEEKAVWDKNDPDFVPEFEFGSDGHYDYRFVNDSNVPVQMGLGFTSCGCSKVSVCLLPLQELEAFRKDKDEKRLHDWHDFPKVDTQGITIPPHSGGVIRLGWTVRKINVRSTLMIKMWTKPQGRPPDADTNLEAHVAFVMPFRFSPQIKDIGTLVPHGMRRAEFVVWSATRDHFELDVKDKRENLCFVCEAKAVPAEEFAALAKKLNEDSGIITRIKSAYRFIVEVHEEREGRHLDMGPFARILPLRVDRIDYDEGVGPLIKGLVRGDIVVGMPEDQGKVDLKNFRVTEAAQRRVSLSAAAGVKLVPDQVPDYLDVTLTTKTMGTGRTDWVLRVVVKPGMLTPGPLPDDTAIFLRMDGTPPRRIRIPVVGNAVPG